MGILQRNVKLATKRLAIFTKRNVERMMTKNFVKLLPRNVKPVTTSHAKCIKKNAKEILTIIVKLWQRNAKQEIRNHALYTKRNAERSKHLPLISIVTH